MANSITTSIFSLTGVNLKSAGSTTIIPAMSGKTFMFLEGWAKITGFSSISVNCSASFKGTTRLGAGQLIADFGQIDHTGGVGTRVFAIPGDGSFYVSAALSSAITFTISTAAVGTTLTADIFLEGIIE